MIVVRVIPRSSKTSIARESDGTYKIKLTAPPVEGRANQQLLELLSDQLQIAARNVTIISGGEARVKRIRIDGVDAVTVASRLSVRPK